MRSWARRLFLLLTSLAAVSTCVFWWRSHHVVDELHLARFTEARDFRLTGIDSACGVLSFSRIEVSPQQAELQRHFTEEYAEGWNLKLSQALNGDPWRSEWTAVGFEFRSIFSKNTPVTGIAYLRLPHWFVAALFSLPLAVTIGRNLRKVRRRSRGQCQTCGYDLRCSPERCPECGTPIPGAPARREWNGHAV